MTATNTSTLKPTTVSTIIFNCWIFPLLYFYIYVPVQECECFISFKSFADKTMWALLQSVHWSSVYMTDILSGISCFFNAAIICQFVHLWFVSLHPSYMKARKRHDKMSRVTAASSVHCFVLSHCRILLSLSDEQDSLNNNYLLATWLKRWNVSKECNLLLWSRPFYVTGVSTSCQKYPVVSL